MATSGFLKADLISERIKVVLSHGSKLTPDSEQPGNVEASRENKDSSRRTLTCVDFEGVGAKQWSTLFVGT
jgi:hypothetical protein